MHKNFLPGIVLFVIILISPIISVYAQDDVEKHPECIYCGMKRQMFAHSRMLLTYDDGSQVATCSIHCSAVDLALKLDKTPTSMQVGDYFNKQLIDAENAVWVIGGEKPGVMTKRAKWAFQDKAAAERFVKENGGKVVTFEDAMKAAYEDMYTDTNMIRSKRKAKRMQMQKTN